MKNTLINLITFYQTYLSFNHGLLVYFAPGAACKYEVSCSEYTKQKIKQFGVCHGIWLGLKRILSCR